MKIEELHESTTSGAIATVAAPMTGGKTINRGTGVYPAKKGGNLLTGRKTNKKFANSLSEAPIFKDKQQCIDYFVQRAKATGKTDTKTAMRQGAAAWERGYRGGPSSKEKAKKAANPQGELFQEAEISEQDLILVPGQGHRLKTGFHAFDPDKAEHEGETLKNSLRTIIRNAQELHTRLENSDQFPEWVSEKIGQIKGMMTSVTEYLISSQGQNEGVIAAGGVGESTEHFDHEISMAKSEIRSAVKSGKRIYQMLDQREELMAWQQSYITLASDYLDSVADSMEEEMHSEEFNEGIVDKIKGIVRREKAKDMPLVQTRRDYAMGKAGDAYNKGEIRKGNQYSAYAERDRKKKNDPTTNPAGTYRTKTSDYTNEGKYGKGMRDCCDSPAQKNQPHVKGCKSYTPTERDRRDDMEKHNVETIPGYKRNKG